MTLAESRSVDTWSSSMTNVLPQSPHDETVGRSPSAIAGGPAEEDPIVRTGLEPSVVIPVVEESLTVSRRLVETGRGVRVFKTVSEREELVDEPLSLDEVLVERTEVNRWLADGAEVPAVRQEGDVTVVPVLEEVLVTQKRLLLKEEIRITRVRREVHRPERVTLRTEQVSVERFDESEAPGGSARE
jgi:uncharacterized protein (TIGR02271 family)